MTPRSFDRSVALVLTTRLVALIGAPVTLWLVATRRPLDEQGFYFIFWNVQALTQLMELGVGGMLVQFASHESPLISWDVRGRLVGDAAAQQRIHALLRESRRWYLRVAAVLLVVGGMAGAWLLQVRGGSIQPAPLMPWLVTIGCTAAYLPLIPLLCTIEGCGRLLSVQRMRLAQVTLSLMVFWLVLPRWGALWGVAAFAILWLSVAGVWLARVYPGLLSMARRALDVPTDVHVGLGRAQWRTGASWLAWWAAPQALTPIMLVTHGPAAAGVVGMSLAIATAPLTLASSWLSARYPRYGALLASGARAELRHLARSATLQAAVVLVVGVAGATAVISLLGVVAPSLASRAMSPLGIALLGAGNLGWLLIQALGSYLRAWREEPLMEMALAGAIGVTSGTLLVATRASTIGTIVTYVLLVLCLALPLAVLGFRRHHQGILGATPSTPLGRP
ncbi:MAG TPA: hypothetical protein VKA54_11085 [Gemmatimonadaceae bacterium]|nr:hypothetical protein [Gemmatimonadaceae bacterium]